jgi:hypothetical protein
LAPLFVTLTPGVPESERRVIAVRAVSIAAVVLLMFGFGGEPLLRALGITLPAFRIAGGVLFLLLAIDMMMVRHTDSRAPPWRAVVEGCLLFRRHLNKINDLRIGFRIECPAEAPSRIGFAGFSNSHSDKDLT